MFSYGRVVLVLGLTMSTTFAYAKGGLWDNIISDYHHYYRPSNLKKTATVLSLSGLLANTGMDRALHSGYQKRIRTDLSDSLAHGITAPIDVVVFKKTMGLSVYVPSYTLSTQYNALGESRVEKWARASIRTVALLAPQQAVLTRVLGAYRPTTQKGSKWRIMKGSRAVSGHAAYGAVPILNAAFQTSSPVARAALKVLGFLPGIARINDKKHYTSQVVLGYGLAYISAYTVNRGDV